MLGLGNILTKGGAILGFPNDFSFNFDGSNDVLKTNDLNDELRNISNLSVSAWIYPTHTGTGDAYYGIVTQWDYSSVRSWGIWLHTNGATDSALHWNGGGSENNAIEDATKRIAINQWTHVCATKDGTAIKLYVNGSEVVSGTDSASTTENVNSILRIGSQATSGSDTTFFKGAIDEVAVWNTTLDASTIAKLGSKPVDLTKYSAANLKLWLRCGDASEPESNTAIARQDFYTDFDGTDDYVNLGNASEFPDDPDGEEFTITAWVNCSVGSDGTIFSKADTSNRAIQLYTNTDDTLSGYVGGTILNQSTVVADGTWHHVVLRSFNDGGTYKGEIYIDGVFKVVGTTGTTTATDRDFLIGARRASDNTDAGYLLTDSSVSNLSIYKTALDAQTIKQFAKSRFTPMRDNRFSVVDFDGTNDYIDTNDSNLIITGNNVTLSAWIRNTDSDSAYFIQSQKGAGSTNLALAVNTDASGTSAGKLSAIIWGGSSHSYVTYNASINDSQWHYVALTTTSSAQVLYLDGVAVATGSNTFSNSASSDHTIIGARGESAGNDFGGSISSVAIYSDAKDADFIYAQYSKGITHNPSADTGLIGLWLMGDDISKAYPTIADSSSNSNDGTITNGASDDIVQQMVAGYDLGAFESTGQELGGELVDAHTSSSYESSANTKTNITSGVKITHNGDANDLAFINDAKMLSGELTDGKLYKMTADVYYEGGSTTPTFTFHDNSTFDRHNLTTTSTTYTRYLIEPSGASAYLKVENQSSGMNVYVQNVSVKKVLQSDLSDTYPAILDVTEPIAGTEILNNFDFSAGTGSNATNWSAENTSVWVFDEDNDRYMWDESVKTGDYNIRQTGANMLIANGLDTGKVYQLTINVTTGSNSTVTMFVTGDNSGHKLLNPSQLVDGDNTFTVGYPVTGAGADNDAIEVYSDASENSYDFWLNSVSLKEVQGNVGTMTQMLSSNLVYSSVLPDQSFLTGVNSAYNFIDLDGSDQSISGSISRGDAITEFTFSSWTNIDSFGDYERIFSGDDGTVRAGFRSTGKFTFHPNLTIGDIDSTGSSYSTGQWYHTMVTYNKATTTLKYYRDGDLAFTKDDCSSSDMDISGLFWIGSYRGIALFLDGSVGQTAIWDRDLSSDVGSIYNLGRHGNLLDKYSDNLVGYWSMSSLDASTGLSDVGNGTIYDRSGQSNHGTATNTESADLKSSPNAQPEGYAKGDTNRSTTTP